jgi:hypothetical protein
MVGKIEQKSKYLNVKSRNFLATTHAFKNTQQLFIIEQRVAEYCVESFLICSL